MNESCKAECPFVAPRVELIEQLSEAQTMMRLITEDAINRASVSDLQAAHIDELLEADIENHPSTEHRLKSRVLREDLAESNEGLKVSQQQMEASFQDLSKKTEEGIQANKKIIDLACDNCGGKPQKFLGRLICGSTAVPLTTRLRKGYPKGE